jgi:hypothetical protein
VFDKHIFFTYHLGFLMRNVIETFCILVLLEGIIKGQVSTNITGVSNSAHVSDKFFESFRRKLL